MTTATKHPSLAPVTFTYEYPRPSVTADVVLFSIREGNLVVLLIKRKGPPFRGAWAFPGGFVEQNEPLDRAALRELREECGVVPPPLEQIGAFGDPGRDPRGHTVTVAFLSFVMADTLPLVAGDDAAATAWHAVKDLIDEAGAPVRTRPGKRAVRLAFDHDRILAAAHARLRARVVAPPPPGSFELVPERFTLTELQRVYEAVHVREVNARSFRARFVGRGIVEPVVKRRAGARGGPPLHLFRWKALRAETP